MAGERKGTKLDMVASGQLNCRPIGIGHAAPDTVITNLDLESVVETNDEWIKTRTGISERRVLLEDETLRSLGVKAANQALEMAGVSAEDIDIVICATSSPDDIFGDATAIAAEIGCTKNTVAFDLTAACSGFLFSTVTAGQFLSSPGTKFKTALVIGADALSRWVDWDDRNACILFGDGAGAMVITNEGEEEPGLLGFSAHSNGNGYGDLNCLYTGESRPVNTPNGGVTLSSGKYGKLAMNGQEVYKFATREVPAVLKEALDAAELTVDDVDFLLLHQANIRIMEIVAKRLGIPFEKVITNLSSYGNTSAASIPIALDEAVRSGRVKKGDVIACAGFGAGLSWGAAIMRWG
jgi:3-oxoacyl-[acyl-carrier-protein] synthase-3